MSHSVHFRDAAGEVQLEDVASLEAALERVEHLRNGAGATEVRVLREVPIAVHTYYRVTAVEESAPGVPAAVPGATEPAGATASGPDAVVPVALIEPPSGAMVMSPPPVQAVADATSTEDGEVAPDTHTGEGRRLFSRS